MKTLLKASLAATALVISQSALAALFLFIFPHAAAHASGEPAIPFVDGRWSGGIETGANGSNFEACWARTVFGDGTSMTLAIRADGSWHFQLSNPGWQLSPSHHYDMIALVDYHPQQVRTIAVATSKTRLEIVNLDRISLLELIESGHTIELTADGFKNKYDLEGSAKIIQRIRNCFAGYE